MVFFVLLLGASIGSFINAFVFRHAAGKSVVRGRSACMRCGHSLSARDLVPVASWLLLRGRCRWCRGRISAQYPAVEAATAVLFLLAFFSAEQSCPYEGGACSLFVIALWFFIAVFIAVFVYDARFMVIPDTITLPAIALGAALQLFFLWEKGALSVSSVGTQIILPAAVAGGFFLVQFIVSKGAWIGGGDIRLGALIGVAVGWPAAVEVLLLAYMAGAIVSLALVAFRIKTMQSHIPFGTFLSAAAVFVLVRGDSVPPLFSLFRI